MDTSKTIEIVKRYTEVIKSFFSIRTVILYGSYANNRQNEFSDIDVAVIVDSLDKDILTSESFLFKLTRDVDFRIEPIIFKKDDPDPSGFLNYIMKNGILIYQA